MVRKLIKLFWTGITCGCTISCIISMIGIEAMGYEWFSLAPRSYTVQVIASMLIGIAWSMPSLVYENDRLSRAQQILIHFGIGFGVFLPVAFYMQWIPMGNVVMALVSISIILLSALLIWCGFYMYYRGETKAMNRQLMNREQGSGK